MADIDLKPTDESRLREIAQGILGDHAGGFFPGYPEVAEIAEAYLALTEPLRVSVSHPVIEAVRKQFEEARHDEDCSCEQRFIHTEPCPFWTDAYCLMEECFHGLSMGERCAKCEAISDKPAASQLLFAEGAERCHPAPCDCWKSTFGLERLISLLTASEQRRMKMEKALGEIAACVPVCFEQYDWKFVYAKEIFALKRIAADALSASAPREEKAE